MAEHGMPKDTSGLEMIAAIFAVPKDRRVPAEKANERLNRRVAVVAIQRGAYRGMDVMVVTGKIRPVKGALEVASDISFNGDITRYGAPFVQGCEAVTQTDTAVDIALDTVVHGTLTCTRVVSEDSAPESLQHVKDTTSGVEIQGIVEATGMRGEKIDASLASIGSLSTCSLSVQGGSAFTGCSSFLSPVTVASDVDVLGNLKASSACTGTLSTTTLTSKMMSADDGKFNKLVTESAMAVDVEISSLKASSIEAATAVLQSLDCAVAVIPSLECERVNTSQLHVPQATVTSLQATTVLSHTGGFAMLKADNLEVCDAKCGGLTCTAVTAETAKVARSITSSCAKFDEVSARRVECIDCNTSRVDCDAVSCRDIIAKDLTTETCGAKTAQFESVQANTTEFNAAAMRSLSADTIAARDGEFDSATIAKLGCGSAVIQDVVVDGAAFFSSLKADGNLEVHGNCAIVGSVSANTVTTADVVSTSVNTEKLSCKTIRVSTVAADNVASEHISSSSVKAAAVDSDVITAQRVKCEDIHLRSMAGEAAQLDTLGVSGISAFSYVTIAQNLTARDVECERLKCERIAFGNLEGGNVVCATITTADIHGANVTCAGINGADVACAAIKCADVNCENIRGKNIDTAAIATKQVTCEGDIACKSICAAEATIETTNTHDLKANYVECGEVKCETVQVEVIWSDTLHANSVAAMSIAVDDVVAKRLICTDAQSTSMFCESLGANDMYAKDICCGSDMDVGGDLFISGELSIAGAKLCMGSGGLPFKVRKPSATITMEGDGVARVTITPPLQTPAGFMGLLLPEITATMVQVGAQQHMFPFVNELVLSAWPRGERLGVYNCEGGGVRVWYANDLGAGPVLSLTCAELTLPTPPPPPHCIATLEDATCTLSCGDHSQSIEFDWGNGWSEACTFQTEEGRSYECRARLVDCRALQPYSPGRSVLITVPITPPPVLPPTPPPKPTMTAENVRRGHFFARHGAECHVLFGSGTRWAIEGLQSQRIDLAVDGLRRATVSSVTPEVHHSGFAVKFGLPVEVEMTDDIAASVIPVQWDVCGVGDAAPVEPTRVVPIIIGVTEKERRLKTTRVTGRYVLDFAPDAVTITLAVEVKHAGVVWYPPQSVWVGGDGWKMDIAELCSDSSLSYPRDAADVGEISFLKVVATLSSLEMGDWKCAPPLLLKVTNVIGDSDTLELDPHLLIDVASLQLRDDRVVFEHGIAVPLPQEYVSEGDASVKNGLYCGPGEVILRMAVTAEDVDDAVQSKTSRMAKAPRKRIVRACVKASPGQTAENIADAAFSLRVRNGVRVTCAALYPMLSKVDMTPATDMFWLNVQLDDAVATDVIQNRVAEGLKNVAVCHRRHFTFGKDIDWPATHLVIRGERARPGPVPVRQRQADELLKRTSPLLDILDWTKAECVDVVERLLKDQQSTEAKTSAEKQLLETQLEESAAYAQFLENWVQFANGDFDTMRKWRDELLAAGSGYEGYEDKFWKAVSAGATYHKAVVAITMDDMLDRLDPGFEWPAERVALLSTTAEAREDYLGDRGAVFTGVAQAMDERRAILAQCEQREAHLTALNAQLRNFNAQLLQELQEANAVIEQEHEQTMQFWYRIRDRKEALLAFIEREHQWIYVAMRDTYPRNYIAEGQMYEQLLDAVYDRLDALNHDHDD
ncbi:hypothetical protein JKP88DRAFT_255641 [Tribonema minus]|uniref:Uncharacterized protein n=1 Tax=Tribonema minus TaxID=303371 RepID=A0A835Z7W9_9STRA|nr:hypothetical protein JKP88DRAFT_255641 [Tribonema minus]